MKRIFVIVMLIIALISCDNLSPGTDIENFIPGIYVRHYEDEYTDSYDTIEIKGIVTSGSEGFSVIKKHRYQKTLDGKELPGKYKAQYLAATYDKDTKTLWLQESGKSIFFDVRRRELKIGEMPYKKIK